MKAENVFEPMDKQKYIDFLHIANKFGAEIDVDEFVADYYTKDMPLYKSIYKRWEDSIADGNPDFSVYGDKIYMTEVFHCWKTCAKRYVTVLKRFVNQHPDMFTNIKTVIDLGCGNAYSTVALSTIFKDAKIIGTNLPGTLQYNIDEYVCSLNERCFMLDETKTFELDSVDIVFASEFFEHLTEPIEFLEKLIFTYQPEYIVFANTFRHMSVGHFLTYKYRGIDTDRMDMNKIFYDTLKSLGYIKVKTGFYNDRPMMWRKIGSCNQVKQLF